MRSATMDDVSTATPMDAYDYGLPPEAVAQEPVEPRSAARLLIGPGVVEGTVPGHATMADLPGLLRRVRDFVEVRGDGVITEETARQGLAVFGVDELGLDKVDRAILDALCRRFGGQPVGLTTLSQCIGEEPDTIEDAYEPFLLQQGLIQRTPRGRVATARARAHLGVEVDGPALF